MIAINNKAFANDRGVIFAFLDDGRVPQQAWTSARIGKISGRAARRQAAERRSAGNGRPPRPLGGRNRRVLF